MKISQGVILLAGLGLTGCELFLVAPAIKSSRVIYEKPIERPMERPIEAWNPIILLAIDDKEQIWLDDQIYTLENIRPVLEEMKAETPKSTALILPDPEASAGVVWDLQFILQELNIPTRVSTP